MSKHHRDPLLEALQQGQPYTWTVAEGGDLASMRRAIKHGQTLTMSPVGDPAEIQIGDIVFVTWHQGYLFHMVGDIQGDRVLIVNSLGKENGWVDGKDILGRVTRIDEPEPRPSIPVMLEQLEAAYRNALEQEQPAGGDAERLLGIVEDLRWYADRIGEPRWDALPRSNRWSFAQRLWRLTRQARKTDGPAAGRLRHLIDRGKACVGDASEIVMLFEDRFEEEQ